MLQTRLLTLDKLDEKCCATLLHNKIMQDKRKIKHDKQKKKKQSNSTLETWCYFSTVGSLNKRARSFTPSGKDHMKH
jgi:hypothetical protein